MYTLPRVVPVALALVFVVGLLTPPGASLHTTSQDWRSSTSGSCVTVNPSEPNVGIHPNCRPVGSPLPGWFTYYFRSNTTWEMHHPSLLHAHGEPTQGPTIVFNASITSEKGDERNRNVELTINPSLEDPNILVDHQGTGAGDEI